MNGGLKIAYVATTFASPSETFIKGLVEGLRRNGHNVRVFANQVTKSELGQSDNFEVKTAPSEALVYKIKRYLASLISGRSVESILLLEKSRLVRAKLLNEIRRWGPDVVYADYGTEGVHLLPLAEDDQMPLVVHFHGFDATARLRDPFYTSKVRDLLESNAKIIVPSNHIRRRLVVASGVQRSFDVIPCVPSRELIVSRRAQTRSLPLRVVAVGRLTEKKSPLALIEAFRIVKQNRSDVELSIIGDGPLRPELERRIKSYGLTECVHILGAQSHDKAIENIASAAVFVQHSVTSSFGDQEGMPVAIMEALLLGVPVVSTLHSGIPEVITDGLDGILVQEYEYEAMAGAIVSILDGGIPQSMRDLQRSSYLNDFDRLAAVEKVVLRAALR